MSARFPHNILSAPLVENYIVDTGDLGAGNDKWTSTTVQSYTVPAGKRWFLYGGVVHTSANATVDVVLYNESDEIVLYLADHAAAGAAAYEEYPTTMIGNVLLPIPMDAGWYVKITCGAAQGAAAEASCLVLEGVAI